MKGVHIKPGILEICGVVVGAGGHVTNALKVAKLMLEGRAWRGDRRDDGEG